MVEDIIVMVEMFDCGFLCGLCDWVMLFIGFVGGFWCFEIVGFDLKVD